MSLEESMKDLAESNRELATALTKYAGVVEKFGLKIEADNGGGAAAATPAKETKPDKAPVEKAAGKGAKGKPAAAKKEEPKDEDEGDDGFGDDNSGDDEDEMPDELTGEVIKAKLFEVKDAYGDKEPALNIIRKLGYNSIPDVKAKDFEKVYKACVVALKNAP